MHTGGKLLFARAGTQDDPEKVWPPRESPAAGSAENVTGRAAEAPLLDLDQARLVGELQREPSAVSL